MSIRAFIQKRRQFEERRWLEIDLEELLAEISGQIGAAQDVVCFWMHYEFSVMSAQF